MSIAIRCDRCHKIFDWSEDNDWNGACFVFNDVNRSVKDFSDKYDLCPSCVKELADWFKSESSLKEKVEVDWLQLVRIMDNPVEWKSGLFWCELSNGHYTGVDNTTHEAWTENFTTKQECFDWLDGKEKE